MDNKRSSYYPTTGPQPLEATSGYNNSPVGGDCAQHQTSYNYPPPPNQQSLAPQASSFHQPITSIGQASIPYFPPPPRIAVHSSDYQSLQFSTPAQNLYQTSQANSNISPNAIVLPLGSPYSIQQTYPQPVSHGSNIGPAVTPDLSPYGPPSPWRSHQQYLAQPAQHQFYNPQEHNQPIPLPSRPYTAETYHVGAQVQQAFNTQYGSPGYIQPGAVGSHNASLSDHLATTRPASLASNYNVSASSSHIGTYANAPPPPPKPVGLTNLVHSKVQGYLSKIVAAQSTVYTALNSQGKPHTLETPNTEQHIGSLAGMPLPPTVTPEIHVGQADQISSGQHHNTVSSPLLSTLPNSVTSTQRLQTSLHMQPLPVNKPSSSPALVPAISKFVTGGHIKVNATEYSGAAVSPAPAAIVLDQPLNSIQASGSQIASPPESIPFVPISAAGVAGAAETHHAYIAPPASQPHSTLQLKKLTMDSSVADNNDIKRPTVESSTHSYFTVQSITQPALDTQTTPPSISQHTFPPPPTSSQGSLPTKKKAGLFSNIISQLGQTKISDQLNANTSTTEDDNSEEDEPMPLVSPVRATGDPNLIARLCSDKREVDYETTWYYLPATPNFLICTWCHENYINGTAAAPSFETIRKRQGRCRFNVPRLTKSLWPTVCRTGDLSTASEYMVRRLHIPDCKGGSGAVMADKVEWFVDVDREIPGFIACEACYEDIILATEFAGRFRKHPSTQGANDKWTCDLCLEYVKRAMKKFSRRKDIDGGWVEFVRTTTERMALPECNGKAICASKIKWYQPREAIENLVFCETCFMDWLAMSPYAREFEVTVVDSKSTYENWMCDLKPINMGEVLNICLVKRLSFSVFHAAASAISASPRCCADNGIVRGKWYNFKAEVSNFGVCEGCYAGILVPNGLAQFWSSKPQAASSEAELFCVFTTRAARFQEFIERWCEMIETGAWAPYEDYIRKWAPILNCVQNDMASKRAWYGWPDCAICQECYEMFVIGTPLTKSMPLQNTYLEEEKVCCMYSPRMRERYTAACAAGSADELLAFSRERWMVYQQTVPTMKTLREKSEMERETANVNMQISATHRCIDTMDSAIGYGGYGYSYHGRSWAGVEADVAWNKAMAGMERANDPALWAEIRRLEGIWKTVE